jgi:tetratricopeptide (TPR) repeat protein
LECFVRGGSAVETERWILDHLRSGCAICQPVVDELLPGLAALPTAQRQLRPLAPLAPLAGAPSRTQAHIASPRRPQADGADAVRFAALACGPGGEDPCGSAPGSDRLPGTAARLPLASRRIEGELSDRADAARSPRGPEDLDADNEAWDRIFAQLEQRLARFASERAAAPRLLDDLLQRPAAERNALVHAGRRFQSLALCDLLLDLSFDAGGRDSFEAIALAKLGILVADHLDTRYYGSAVVHDLKARAWAYLGNARRLGSDLAGAEQALSFADSLAEEGSADPLEEARLLDLKALLLSDQGWFEEAAELLDTAVEIYEDVKDLHGKGRTLIAKGVYVGCSGRPQLAVELIAQGLALLDAGLEPRLALAAGQELAWFLNECGRCEHAQDQLDSCRHRPGAVGDVRTELRMEWLESRIAHRSGRWQEAELRLGGLPQRFVAAGLGYEAALVMLDLVTLYLDLGRSAEIRRLADELLPAVLALDVHRQAAAALLAFQQAAAAGHVTPALVHELTAYLRRARKNPCLSFPLAA